ncbi:MAG TPA: M4 family metallopeptidase [Ignavibacteriales bacterium]|nr:M4 family metallopeptidase [Ignavibacteriales bacterium]
MRTKFYFVLSLLIILSAEGFSGSIKNKKQSGKTFSSSGVNNSSLARISSNLNSLLQKNGFHTGGKTYSLVSGQMNTNLFLPRPGDSNKLQKVYWNKESGTPRLIEINSAPGKLLSKTAPGLNAAASASNFLVENKSLLKIKDPAAEFQLKSQLTDQFNMSHLKFTQTYKGLEVWAKEIIVHLDNSGSVKSVNGIYEPTPDMITDTEGKLSSSDAIKEATDNLKNKTSITRFSPALAKIMDYQGPSAKKIIWHDNSHIPHLAWFVEVRSDIAHDWYYFIDANTGSILNSYNNVCYDGAQSASGKDLEGVTRTFHTLQYGSTYFLSDISEPMYNAADSKIPDGLIGAIVGLDLRNKDLDGSSSLYFVTSSDNQWTDPAAVSAHYNAVTTYNYFLNSFSRNSIDDKGMTIYSTVHVTESGKSMENAFWSGKIMCYGDGGQYFKPLAGGLDVAAHEMTHGVTQYSAGLEYQGQSGALNESMSDIFGALVDTENWQMGEKIIKDLGSFPSGCLRDLSNPHNGAPQGSPAWQPANMTEFVETEEDNGGVHTNSGIPNYAFYLAATNIGRSDAAKIWYRALTVYMTKSSLFADARIATEKAAADLFGQSSSQLQQVKNAWDQVEVKEDGATPPPPPSTLEGAEWVLMTNTEPSDPNSIYMAKTKVTSNSDFFALSKTQVGNRPAVSDATGIIIFVDKSNNLRALVADPNNPQETVLEDSGVWGSVAIGPGLNSMALTSKYQDTTIYYLDITNNVSKTFKIATKSYDASDAKTALYADELSFEPSGRYLLFDAYNELKNSTGSPMSFWTLDILDVETGYMDAVFPPQNEGVNVANPSFSKTSQTRFTFDYFDANIKQNYVMAADFNTGDVAAVAGPLSVYGYPTYSADDRTIAYHDYKTISGTDHETIEQIALKSNFLEPDGTASDYVTDATYPNWFVIGTRTTGVENKGNTLPENFTLSQNFPNPFNPSTSIRYELPQTVHAQLKVFDMLGKVVATLVDEVKTPGSYTVSFNSEQLSLPSGVYIYTLQAGSFRDSKKLVLLK